MSPRRPSTESSDSFELISPPRRSSTDSHDVISDDLSSDEDQIVWNVAASPFTESVSSPPSLTDDDFILLNVPSLSPPPPFKDSKVSMSTAATGSKKNRLKHNEKDTSPKSEASSPIHSASTNSPPATPSRKTRRHRGHASVDKRSQSPESPSTSKTTMSHPSSPSKKKKPIEKRNRGNQSKPCPPSSVDWPPRGLGARPVVDDVSERGDDPNVITTTLYEEAVRYINWYVFGCVMYHVYGRLNSIFSSFLSEPMENKAAHLALLQALIIELGFFTPLPTSEKSTETTEGQSSPTTPSSPTSAFSLSDLPHSMTAAKSFIKSHVFLNVRDYMAVRAQGQEALQSVLHPSRRSLLTQLRKKSSRVPRTWVKERGLNVFLVSCH